MKVSFYNYLTLFIPKIIIVRYKINMKVNCTSVQLYLCDVMKFFFFFFALLNKMLSNFKRFMTGEPCSFARFQVVIQDEEVSKCSTVPSLISILRVILAYLMTS